MATTFSKIITAEFLTDDEMDVITGSPVADPDSGHWGAGTYKGGTASYRMSSATGWFGVAASMGSSFDAGLWFRWNNTAVTNGFTAFNIFEDDAGSLDRVAYIEFERDKRIVAYMPTSGALGSRVLTAVGTTGMSGWGMRRTNKWVHLGCSMSNTAVKVWIDGQLVIDESGTWTHSRDGIAFIDSSSAGFNTYAYMDDMYWASTPSGSAPEAKKMYSALPDADDTADWTPSAGVDNYAMVDEDTVPDDGTTYVQAAAGSLIDVYEHAAVGIPDYHDIGVCVVFARSQTSGSDADYYPADFRLELGASSSTGNRCVAPDASGTWENYYDDIPDKPGGSGWTEADFDNMLFGYESQGAVGY